MKKFILLSAMFLFIASGCSYFKIFHPAVQQGNVLTKKEVNKIKLGMRKNEVEKILGAPVLSNKITSNKLNYVYTFKDYNEPIIEKKLILIFKNDVLIKIENSRY